MHLLRWDEAKLERVAHIIGPSSVAAQALKELKQRRAAGETVSVYIDRADGAWVIGPTCEVDSLT